MRILLTGTNGMLGSTLSKELSCSNYTTLATGKNEYRISADYLHQKFRYQSMDICNEEEVLHTVNSFRPNVIIHAAAMTQVDDCEANKMMSFITNVEATRYLIHAANEVCARFCYISTDFVFSGEEGPYAENDATNPVNYYGKTKELAEQHVMESNLDWTIIRTVLLYGKAEHINRTNFIYWVKNNLEKARHIHVVADQIRTPTYIPDVTTAILNSIVFGAQGIYHVSGKDLLTPYQMAVGVAKKLGIDASFIHPVDASYFSQKGKRPLKTGFIIEKALHALKYNPKTFNEALDLIF